MSPREGELVKRRVGGNPSHPGSKAPRWIEAGMRPISPPECIHQSILRRTRITDNAQDPAIYLPLEQSKQGLERVPVPLHEPLEKVAGNIRHPSYCVLPSEVKEGSVTVYE